MDTSILSQPAGEPGRQSVTERWDVHGCRKTYAYQLVFTEDGRGGTFMKIQPQP